MPTASTTNTKAKPRLNQPRTKSPTDSPEEAFTLVGTFTQIGIHLVFFLHLGSGPDNTNNILALAFGVLIVFLVIIGSVWIIANLNSNMMSNALSGERIITDPGSVTLASWLIAVEGF